MPMKPGKPNLSNGLKTGFPLMGKKVIREAPPQKPYVKGQIATNHPIASVRGTLSKKKGKMY